MYRRISNTIATGPSAMVGHIYIMEVLWLDKDTQRKVNRNNRKRGGKFEKWGADFLDMDVVPYSGSNARFGYGDVRDSKWLGEFKNITPTDDGVVIIKNEWFVKNNERSKDSGRMPFLAWMPFGGADKYIILDPNAFEILVDGINNNGGHDLVQAIRGLCYSPYVLDKKSWNTVNLHIPIKHDMVTRLRPKYGVSRICLELGPSWYMMHIGHFKMMLSQSGMKGVRSGDQCQS